MDIWSMIFWRSGKWTELRSYQVWTSTGVVRRNWRDLDKLPSQDEHSSGNETTPMTQFSTSSDTSQLRRSSRKSKHLTYMESSWTVSTRTGGRCSTPWTLHFELWIIILMILIIYILLQFILEVNCFILCALLCFIGIVLW